MAVVEGHIDRQKGERLIVEGLDKALASMAVAIERGAKARVNVDTGETRENIKGRRVGALDYEVESSRPSEPMVPTWIHDGTARFAGNPYLTQAADEERGRAAGKATTEIKRRL